MEIKLDVLICTCIKQRKPWPRISWIGQVGVTNFHLNKTPYSWQSFNHLVLFTSFAGRGDKSILGKSFECTPRKSY